jgi:SAM-dependent methyltransferase
MDVRDSENPLVLSAGRWLARVNSRHPWSHNEHFHGWILRNLPARRQAAVDVGCGTGMLTGKLAPHFARVTGIDADEGMAAAASARLADDPRVSIMRCRFGAFAAAAGDGEADLITMVAVLHHLDLGDALARIPRLLAPGGRLLVVGLAKVDSLTDAAVDLMSSAANPVMGLIKHPRPVRPADGPAAEGPVADGPVAEGPVADGPVADGPAADGPAADGPAADGPAADGPAAREPVMPVRDPSATVAEIAAAASARLPGTTIRRRLFFRYTLRWDKPQ